jgi:hypothetical protein
MLACAQRKMISFRYGILKIQVSRNGYKLQSSYADITLSHGYDTIRA